MLAMQYSIQLPQGYDDKLIIDRVGQRKKLFDGLDGLQHKAFLYNGSDKLYAPFYVWQNLSQARHFLMDQLFRGVIETFKRPRVRSWVVLHQDYGNRALRPTHAIREIDVIPAGKDIEMVLMAEQEKQKQLLTNPHLYYSLTAFDPDRWELIHYHLWKDAASAPRFGSDCIQTYDVLHVSEPLAAKAA